MGIEFLPVDITSKPDIEIRRLTLEEIRTLEPIFRAQGADMPNPSTSFVMAAIQDGRVIGFQVTQFRVHVDPMWIEKGQSAVWTRIIKATEEEIAKACPGGATDVYVFVPPGRLDGLAKVAGMQPEPWVVWSKRIIGVDVDVDVDVKSDKDNGVVNIEDRRRSAFLDSDSELPLM